VTVGHSGKGFLTSWQSHKLQGQGKRRDRTMLVVIIWLELRSLIGVNRPRLLTCSLRFLWRGAVRCGLGSASESEFNVRKPRY
jgi:hypothetical protein